MAMPTAEADEVADPDQRHRQAGRDGRRAGAEREAARRFGGDELGLGEDGVGGRDERAQHDRGEPALVLLRPADPGADLEHFGGGDAFGIGQVRPVTSARRSGTEYITPRMPPRPITATDSQKGKPVHQPTMIRPGRTKMIADSVPAAEAMVWTMLFSWIVELAKNLSTAIEITAAGIEVAKVIPSLSPR